MNAAAIPKAGATLLVASHPNDLPDILLTFLTSNRDLLFVANVAATDSPAVRWTYAGLGVIPVSRVRDARALKARGEDASAINANAFVRVVDALRQGHCVAIFPEGVVPDPPRLGTLRNGAAKMALQAIDEGVPLTMIPIGYQYECAPEPRSAALCVVGDAVAVAQWQPVNPAKRISEFTDFIGCMLQAVTRNARTQRDADVLASIAAAAGATLALPHENPMVAAHLVQRTLSCLSAADRIFVADSTAPAAIGKRKLVEQFESDAMALSTATKRFGARSWSARDQADVLHAAGEDTVPPIALSTMMLLLRAPLAAIGWVWHAIPWWATYTLGKRLAPRPAEIAALTLVPGLYVIVLWYVSLPLLLLALGVSAWFVFPLFILQARLGDYAIAWRDHFRSWRLIRRVAGAPATDREAIRMMSTRLRECWQHLV